MPLSFHDYNKRGLKQPPGNAERAVAQGIQHQPTTFAYPQCSRAVKSKSERRRVTLNSRLEQINCDFLQKSKLAFPQKVIIVAVGSNDAAAGAFVLAGQFHFETALNRFNGHPCRKGLDTFLYVG